MQDICRDHCQILSVMFLKLFIELNVNSDMIIGNMKLVELNISIVNWDCFLEYIKFEDDLVE